MKLERDDVYFWTIIIMLAVSDLSIIYLVNENRESREEDEVRASEERKYAIEQNNKIIANQDNNSASIKQLINESRINQEQQVYYLLTVLNQSNIIGNQTANDIQRAIDKTQESINETQKLQQNLSEARRSEARGFLNGLSILLEDTDEELDDIKAIVLELSKMQNITLVQQVLRDEFQLSPEQGTFTFPNGTVVNLTDLFRPAALLTTEGQLRDEMRYITTGKNLSASTTGNTSAFLGGPVLTSEDISRYLSTANQTGNLTSENITKEMILELVPKAEGQLPPKDAVCDPPVRIQAGEEGEEADTERFTMQWCTDGVYIMDQKYNATAKVPLGITDTVCAKDGICIAVDTRQPSAIN